MDLWFVFPTLALVLGVTVSIYLFIEWLHHGRRPWFLFLWSCALFLFFWFQVPLILSSLGRVVTVTDFNFFFALTLPITFLALILVYLGVVEVTGFHLKRRFKILLSVYFLSSIFFFAWQFIDNGGIIKTYALPLIGNIVFYLPLRVLIILTLIRWLSTSTTLNTLGTLGALGIIGESVLGITRNFLILKNVLAYPPEFWYTVLSGLKIFFVLQTLSVILLAIGFYLLHRMYYRSKNNIQDKSTGYIKRNLV